MNRLWMFIKKYKIIILVACAPILINYLLFTWKAPGLMGKTSDWFNFLGSYLGLIGAVSVALYQIKTNKESERQREVNDNRSYASVQEFGATLMLVGVRTHENSRIIKTEGYKDLLKKIRPNEYKSIKVGYLKISHHGGSEVIYNCAINVELEYEKSGQEMIDNIQINVGSIEKGTEVFIPVVPYGIKRGEYINHRHVTFEYSTLIGERLKLDLDFVNRRETLVILNNPNEEIIYNIEIKDSGWIFPNKIDHDKLKSSSG